MDFGSFMVSAGAMLAFSWSQFSTEELKLWSGLAGTTQALESTQVEIPQCEEKNLLAKDHLVLDDLDLS